MIKVIFLSLSLCRKYLNLNFLPMIKLIVADNTSAINDKTVPQKNPNTIPRQREVNFSILILTTWTAKFGSQPKWYLEFPPGSATLPHRPIIGRYQRKRELRRICGNSTSHYCSPQMPEADSQRFVPASQTSTKRKAEWMPFEHIYTTNSRASRPITEIPGRQRCIGLP